MMRTYLLGIFALGAIGLASAACADGMLLPVRPQDPAFSVAYHRVKVSIDRQIATTEIDQAFHSHASRPIEGTYIFPLAEGMSISRFSMYVGKDEELTHRVLDKEEAARIYNDIVRSRQDPALLEWLGTRMIRARVFPIDPGQDKRIRIAYQEVLKAEGGAVKYVYPLKTEKISTRPLKECSVEISLRSDRPLRSVYSPTHDVTIRRDAHTATATYKANDVLPDQDLVLYYTVSEKDLGLDVLAYRDPGQGDGFFLLLAAPKADIAEDEVQPKDVVFVLDTSGSMGPDRKLEQAKAALKYCVSSLDHRDRFTIIPFSTDARPWQSRLREATAANLEAGQDFVSGMRAEGGTNINEALQAALEMFGERADADAGRARVIIFLTDGQPTVGVTDVNQILTNVRKANTGRVRIFDFGVGYDYNAHFLDKLALEHNGFAENVLPNEDLEVKVSGFYAKVSAPLLMDLKLDWGGAEVYDIYPKALPDLFKGSQLIIAGRYKAGDGSRTARVRLTGEAAGRRQEFQYTVTFPGSAYDDEFIPRLWATRKIGYLEDEIRLHGTNRELLEEIIRLSKAYGILTEYTSFLVDMDVRPGGPARPRPRLIGAEDSDLAKEAERVVGGLRTQQSGASGVTQSANRKSNMNAAQVAPSSGSYIVNDQGARVQMQQMRNISQRSFVQNGTQWVDVNYRDTQRRVDVKAFSPAYFQLASLHPRMAQYLSMGDQVMVVVKDTAFNVGAAGREGEFTGQELEGIRKKMGEEFGVPAPPAAARAAAGAAGHHQAPMLALLLAPILAALLPHLRRKGQA